MSYDPIVLDSFPALLQKSADVVGRGYTSYCAGFIKLDRAQDVVAKFDLNYRLNQDRRERAFAKQIGLGNAVLILACLKEPIVGFNYWLFVTPPDAGPHPAHTSEKLQDALSAETRVRINGYELIRYLKKELGRPQAKIPAV